MQSVTRQSRDDPRPLHQRRNRTKPDVYGEAHLIMGVRDTIVEFQIAQDGSGTFKVKRSGVEVAHVEWPAERVEVVGLTKREEETL